MWRLPEDVLASRDADRALASVLPQLKKPDEFVSRLQALYVEETGLIID